MPHNDFTQKLQDLMHRAGFSSFKALSRASSVSEWQILQLRRGKLEQMRVSVLLQLSHMLRISLSELVTAFSVVSITKEKDIDSKLSTSKEIADLKKEYQRSQSQLAQQQEVLLQEFQQSSLQLLESLLLQFPTAAYRARENPELAAVKILPLVEKPLERLLQQWGVAAIAPVGAEIPYDPQLHQLIDGKSQLGDIVKVRYTGYLQGDKLLYRAKVSPVEKT
ncbi:MAG: nucleotide exchange factor GrpE [Goleter apudmare HA4340-LM2]|jgi:molecular chaperone GrpE (heat shock protein)/DNA-binding Xre family transcriptional regulator|nr:nucleotide exchange factor GrpE [Goleter apudmare HA4340-LM2]